MLKPKQQKTFDPFTRHTIEINSPRKKTGYIEGQVRRDLKKLDWPQSGRRLKVSVTIAGYSPNGEGKEAEQFGWYRYFLPNGMKGDPRLRRKMALYNAFKQAKRYGAGHAWFVVGSNKKLLEYVSVGPIATVKEDRYYLSPEMLAERIGEIADEKRLA